MYPRISSGSPLDPWRRVQGDVEGSQKAGRSIFLPKRCHKTNSAADELKPMYADAKDPQLYKEVGLLCFTVSVFPFLILPYFLLSRLLSSSPIPSYPIPLRNLVSSHLISSHLLSSHLTSPHLVSSYHPLISFNGTKRAVSHSECIPVKCLFLVTFL